MSTLKKVGLLLPLMLIVSACALNEVSPVTPPPAMTLNPPPSLIFTGKCENTKDLETWLQITTGLIAQFQTRMNEAAGKDRNEAYPITLELVEVRNAAYGVATPDCASDAQLILSDAMNQAVGALQAYVNGTASDTVGIIAEVNNRLDQVTASQAELINRVNTQIQNQVQATP